MSDHRHDRDPASKMPQNQSHHGADRGCLHPFRSLQFRYRYNPLLTVLAVLITAVYTNEALALDLDSRDGLITDTIASGERLNDYDQAKQYGAEKVLDRDRRYVMPDGLRVQNYLVFPKVSTDIIFDDNIFGRDIDRRSDIRFEIKPEINFQSRFKRHILNFSLGGKIVQFLENTDQNYEDVKASLDGALHFDHAHTLAVHLISERTHRITDLTETGREAFLETGLIHGAVPVLNNGISVGITRDVGRLYGTLSAAAHRLDFEDVSTPDGTIVDQDVRDTDILSTQLRAGYRISPGYEFVSKVRLLRQYNTGVDDLNRDSTGYEGLAGIAFEASPVLKFRALAGYGYRDFDDPSISNVSTSLFEGQVEWLPTQRMTATANVQRQLVDSLGVDTGSRIETVVSGRIDYDVYNNIVLGIQGKYAEKDFIGTGRFDETYSAKISLDYFMNKNWLFTFAYEHEANDSTDDLLDATRNKFLIGAKLQF